MRNLFTAKFCPPIRKRLAVIRVSVLSWTRWQMVKAEGGKLDNELCHFIAALQRVAISSYQNPKIPPPPFPLFSVLFLRKGNWCREAQTSKNRGKGKRGVVASGRDRLAIFIRKTLGSLLGFGRESLLCRRRIISSRIFCLGGVNSQRLPLLLVVVVAVVVLLLLAAYFPFFEKMRSRIPISNPFANRYSKRF